MNSLNVADLTVLMGLVRRAKVNAEKRLEKRRQLHRSLPARDPGQTKVHKLGQLFAKLEMLRCPEPCAALTAATPQE
jgi:hypothetical protein